MYTNREVDIFSKSHPVRILHGNGVKKQYVHASTQL